jgi:SSS family transporter
MSSGLTPTTILIIIAIYFAILMFVSWLTGRSSGNEDFFIGGRKSPWVLVAVGMIGASLSGVTFISVPGVVGAIGENQAFSYMQLVVGYIFGYMIIATVLMPMYYKLNLTSIYGYLESRFGKVSYKTGAAFFLLSRVIGASFRLFLIAIVLQKFVLDSFGVPLWVTVAGTIVLIWIYTFQGGIKTIVWTDTLQTICMLGAVIMTIFAIGNEMNLSIGELIGKIGESDYGQIFFFKGGWSDPNNFFKQVLAGALITIVMTGMDQDMMQKNLSCKNIGDAQKNMFTFSTILILANLMFITLGALLWIYAGHIDMQVPARTDQLFPEIALNHLSPTIGIVFILGLIAAAYSSADSALTSLTTAFCVDFLNFEKNNGRNTESELKKKRWMVHISFSVILFAVILYFNSLTNDAVINNLFKAAGYTYGPLLGLFSFGMMTKRKIKDRWALAVCLIAPMLTFWINSNSDVWFNGFQFGFLLLALNGFLTFLGLLIISKPPEVNT